MAFPLDIFFSLFCSRGRDLGKMTRIWRISVETIGNWESTGWRKGIRVKGDPVREGWRWVGFGVTASWPGVTRIHLLPPLLPRASLSLSLPFLFLSLSPFPSRRRYVSTYVRDGSPDNLIRHGDKTYRGRESRVSSPDFCWFSRFSLSWGRREKGKRDGGGKTCLGKG